MSVSQQVTSLIAAHHQNLQSGNTLDEQKPAPLGNHGKPLLVGIYRGIIRNQAFVGGAKWISSIHRRNATGILRLGWATRFGELVGFLAFMPYPTVSPKPPVAK